MHRRRTVAKDPLQQATFGESGLLECREFRGEEDDMPEEVIASRDRSAEFAAAVRSLRGGALTRVSSSASRSHEPSRVLANHAQFMRNARSISTNIAGTYGKLERLAALARKKSLFDDRPAEVQELSGSIRGDLVELNRQIATLGELPRGKRGMQTHSSGVIFALQSRLAGMSAHFKEVLEVRSENLRHQNTRRERFTEGLPPLAATSALLDDEAQSQENAPLLDRRLQQTIMRDESDMYATQRAETMHNIESTIVELGGIFQQLAHMVKEQDEAVTRIDANIYDAELNVQAAHSQILKYFQSVTGNRMLMLKIFGVLIFFFIFFVIFLS